MVAFTPVHNSTVGVPTCLSTGCVDADVTEGSKDSKVQHVKYLLEHEQVTQMAQTGFTPIRGRRRHRRSQLAASGRAGALNGGGQSGT